MARKSSQFEAGRQPLQQHPYLKLKHVMGPIPFLNPTRAYYEPMAPNEKPIKRLWRSRDNRKGRHALVLSTTELPKNETEYELPSPTATLSATARGIWRMFTFFPYWDVSYLVATVFTFGSVIWVINAFFAWLPLQDPGTTFNNESLVGGGVTAFIGATFFEVGSVFLLLEAVNEKQSGCFGWAVQSVVRKWNGHDERAVTLVKEAPDECEHHHAVKKSLLGVRALENALREWVITAKDGRTFNWLPSWTELKTHYIHELGFQASLVQFIGASIFWIAGLTGLPGLINHMSWNLTDGVYWAPQIVGGSCFIISGLLFTLETQPKWYIPAPLVLGWHIGAWNFIGGIGFTLCGALGPASSNSGVAYQTSLATFWGSWAFLVGSTIQWYESLQKNPVEKI